ncbi:MAG: histidine kinase [Bacteroidota bacterium]
MKILLPYRNLSIPLGYLFGFGIVMAILMVLQEYVNYFLWESDHEFAWLSLFSRSLVTNLVIIMFSPIIELTAKWLLEKKTTARLITRCILISIVVSLLHRIVGSGIYGSITQLLENNTDYSISQMILSSMLAGLIFSLILYWMGVGVFMAAISQQKLVNKERELTNAKVHALMTQLRPHFLFNTLNSISALIDINKVDAQKVINRFADLLRFVLSKETTQFTRLSEEIRFIKNYLNIEKERYRERLSLYYDLGTDTLSERVPTLILQPLVENAIKHGIAKKIQDGEITIVSRFIYWNNNEEVRLALEVRDNGPGCSDKYKQGVGLANVNGRLQELYGNHYVCELINDDKGGCTARIVIPLTQRG